MFKVVEAQEIEKVAWETLVKVSPVASWFQTPEAYCFFDSLSFMETFVIGVVGDGTLKGVVVGSVQKDGGRLKQFFSRRVIILGGPLLSEDITDEELKALLDTLKTRLKRKAIFIETRNFNDYGRWRKTFEECGFRYEAHLNFHVDASSLEKAQENVGKHRWRAIRVSFRDGAIIVGKPNWQQVERFYAILADLYKTKVKTPLFPFEFFRKLYDTESAKYFLVEYEGEIVGGSLCVCLEGKAVYEWAKCGLDSYRKNIRPSSVATWEGIRYAAENGYARYDFMGAGKPGDAYGVRDFKAEFGGELVEHGRFVHVCNPWLFNMGKTGVKIMKRL